MQIVFLSVGSIEEIESELGMDGWMNGSMNGCTHYQKVTRETFYLCLGLRQLASCTPYYCQAEHILT
jgi:hypothetical protein